MDEVQIKLIKSQTIREGAVCEQLTAIASGITLSRANCQEMAEALDIPVKSAIQSSPLISAATHFQLRKGDNWPKNASDTRDQIVDTRCSRIEAPTSTLSYQPSLSLFWLL